MATARSELARAWEKRTAQQARTSSAAGLFQFIEQTWLATVKQSGAKHGYGQYADLIHRGGDGRSADQRQLCIDDDRIIVQKAADRGEYIADKAFRVNDRGILHRALQWTVFQVARMAQAASARLRPFA